METAIKSILQKTLGFDSYLFLFSLFKIYSIKYDKSENDFIHFMNKIKDDGIIIDVGANIGLMTTHLAKKFKKSHVYSIEPIPCNQNTFKKNVSFFNLRNVTLMDYAVGNREGTIEMVLPEVDSVKMHGLCHVVDNSIPKKSQGQHFTIPIKTLDSIDEFRNAARPIVGIKIDVEHFEWAVLEGAREILQKHKPVIYCELANNDNRKKSMEILTGMGYKPMIVNGKKVVDFESRYENKLNFIFVPENGNSAHKASNLTVNASA